MDCKLAALVIALCVSMIVAENPSYMLQFSRTILTNDTNILHLHTFDLSAPGVVTISLTKRDNETELAEKVVKVDEGENNLEIPFHVPVLDGEYSAMLKINGSFETDKPYKIYATDSVNLQKVNPYLVFIQTDKPLYKPGQTVMFRVLRVDKKFRPVKDHAHAEIYIQDPADARLAQWKDVDLRGIVQYDFPLSSEPVEGMWKIVVSIGGVIETTTFEVKEYVLPTFSVEIKPPPYILGDAKTIDIEICAKYTYGKQVEGKLIFNCSMETYGWQNDKGPVLEEEHELEGCYTYTLNVSLIEPDSYSYRRIMIVASVTEKGTGIVRNETKYIDRTLQPLNLNFCDSNRNSNAFKPGLPYNNCLKVTNPDGTPADCEEIEICHTVSRERILYNWLSTRKSKICKNFTSDDEGIVNFILPPQNTDTTGINIEAKSTKFANRPPADNRVTLSQPQSSMSLKPWFSKSGSFLQIQSKADSLSCGTEQKIELLYTAKEAPDTKLYYQVINNGKVLKSGEVDLSFDTEDVSSQFLESDDLLDGEEIQIVPSASAVKKSAEEEDCPSAREARYIPPVGSTSISIDVDANLSPNFYVLVFYNRDDRETVADSQKFTVEKCFNNKVSIDFGDEVKQPGTKTTLTLKASPDSLCGIKVVDKSVSLMDSSDQLTLEKVFNAIERFNIGPYYSKNHCNEAVYQPGLRQKYVAPGTILPPRPWSSSSYDDSMAAYESAGMSVFSDLEIVTRPCKENEYRTNTFAAYGGYNQAYPAPPRPVALASTARRPPAAGQESMAEADSISLKSVKDVRDEFPETWLFKLMEIGEEGKLVFKEKLPDTITEWVGSAVCLNSEDGLGLSNTTTIKGFQPFFLTITLPYSIVRGEKFSIAFSLFNYIEEALPITFSVDDSDGFEVTEGSVTEDVCVLPSKSESRKIQIKPTKLGPLNITVRAKTAESNEVCGEHETSDRIASDGMTKSVIIEPEGFRQEKVESTIFCPKDAEDGVFKKDFSLALPEDLVPDSERSWITITGNIMGMALTHLDNLVQVPTGCGEQNMAKFTPIISVLDYLTATEELSKELKSKAVGYLKIGYQREQKYRHPDGSYSAFGVSDKVGSIFLTAFVVSSFSQSMNYISIDNDKLAQSLNWITSKQQVDGSYPNVGRTVDSYLKGGLGPNETTGLRTAYILSCLLTADYKNQTAIDGALDYLKENDKNLTAYAAAVYAYTTALAGKKDMTKKYITEVYKYVMEKGDTVHFQTVNASDSLLIETASYVVLTLIEVDESLDKILPIIRWLSKKRNPYGGFSSTQDTVMGMKALSKFAELINKDELNLNVIASHGFTDELAIDKENKFLVHQAMVPVPAEVNVEATGSGCGLIQTVLRYNTYSPAIKAFFRLTVDTVCLTDDCTKIKIYLETSYVPSGLKSNMAVVEIKMLSGMAPVKSSLDQLITRDSPVRRVDVENNVVYCYIYEISNAPMSIAIEVEEIVPVENRQPAEVSVWDYYATDKKAITSYNIKGSGKDNEKNEKSSEDDEKVGDKDSEDESE